MGREIFSRNVPGTTERLLGRCVGVAGCGGLGSNAAVALTRAGVGRLILADHDVVEASNLNRQHYFAADVGRPKVEALADHLRAINPGVRLDVHQLELEPGNLDRIFPEADLLVEAFDAAGAKRWLIETWCRLRPDRPLVCGNGLSGYGRTADLGVRSAGRVYFCGDGETEGDRGLCSARVAIVANMQANVAIALMLDGTP